MKSYYVPNPGLEGWIIAVYYNSKHNEKDRYSCNTSIALSSPERFNYIDETCRVYHPESLLMEKIEPNSPIARFAPEEMISLIHIMVLNIWGERSKVTIEPSSICEVAVHSAENFYHDYPELFPPGYSIAYRSEGLHGGANGLVTHIRDLLKE
jgi:hypothetical protein